MIHKRNSVKTSFFFQNGVNHTQQEPHSCSSASSATSEDNRSLPFDRKLSKLRLAWSPLIYFFIGISIIQKIFWLFSFLLPFPVNYLAILAIVAKLAEGHLGQNVFDNVAEVIKSLFSLLEERIGYLINLYWNLLSFSISRGRENKCAPDCNAGDVNSAKFQIAKTEILHALAIATINSRLHEKYIQRKFNEVNLTTPPDLLFEPTATIDFYTSGYFGISFKVRNEGVSLLRDEHRIKVRAKMIGNNFAPDDFHLTEIKVIQTDEWRVVDVLE